MIVFLDIETVPGQTEVARQFAKASIKPPGTLKKPESIAQWWAQEAEAAADEAWRKQSLDGGLHGEVVALAACTDEGAEWFHCRAQGDDEAELLRQFFRVIDHWQEAEGRALVGNADGWPVDVYPVAHNAQFDLPFLWRRARVLGVDVPAWLPAPLDLRIGKSAGDTMVLWAGLRERVSLDNLCRALGLESPKITMDGSQVFDRWLSGAHAEIARYNLRDVHALRAVWHRLHGREWEPA